MAFKAINFDGGVGVTTLAEIGRFGRDALTDRAGVTGNAGLERITTGTNAAAQRVIALVSEQFHVVAPHKSGFGNTFTPACFFNQRLQTARRWGLTLGRSCRAHAQ